ncbi:Predicted ATP-dependent endonuclease of the OLD family, contains P-loop ATPase and TOPRIM domains [Fibrobacter sp. UWCM]|uniref:ATP-dependent nuclease n=1 Tax=Fibrobacter sp. UWCM TaxID=1896208 RepID=UPI000919EF0B|nr:AAA family ATPase [Fibrobacter sp. UWCM]SHH94287.1 Predicted ATP-dependent endonuclease of the OLD family, contains P-loop ATPase and TOPRIM domains [Fibrobacter sp. UWCM]
MKINKLVIKNYKLIRDVVIPLNPEINIFVGENDAGKSSILEALSILTTGKLNGIALERQLKANLFNSTTRQEYIDAVGKGQTPAPPQIVFEAYFEDDLILKGSNNTLSEDAVGINVTIKIADNNTAIYQKMLNAGDVTDIPIELYTVDYHYFNGGPVSFRYGPFKSVFIDTTRKEYVGIINQFVSESITENLSPEQLRDLAIAYNRSRREFHEDDTVKTLNNAVKSVIQGRSVSLGLREDDVEAWKKQLSIVVDDVPFEHLGFGTQNTLKIELALRNADVQANVVLMEEPENNLSFTNMARLVGHVSSSTGKQVFISTHSSYIANKLSLENVILVKDGDVTSYKKLPDDTKKYFIKLPGYDTLRFVLASKAILVEGPTDDLIIQRAYKDKYGKLPHEDGVDIIVVDSLAFKHYCDIALLMGKRIVVVTDNDGDVKKNIQEKYEGYLGKKELTFYYEENAEFNTIEPSVLAVNCENGQPVEQFKRIISSENCYSLKSRDYDGVLEFMTKNKTEWAFRVFEAEESIKYPEYIQKVIAHYDEHH